MRWQACILTKHKQSWALLVLESTRVKGMLPLARNMSSCSNSGVSTGGREPFWRCSGKRLIHDGPCRRQTGKPLRNSYTSQKNGPQTKQPTNKLTSFDLSISFTKWPSIRAAATDLKIPQKMAWWAQTRLKSLYWRPTTKNLKRFQKAVLLISIAPHKGSSLITDKGSID